MVVTPAAEDMNPSNQQVGKATGKSLPKAGVRRSDGQQYYEKLESYEMIKQTAPDVSHLEQRVLHLETALTRVIQHLENQGAKSSESSEA